MFLPHRFLPCVFWITRRSCRSWRQVLVLCLLAVLARSAMATAWVEVKGLDGLHVAVSIAADPSTKMELKEAIDRGLFQDMTHEPRRPIRSAVTFWRFDIETPEGREGETVWFRAVPPIIWDADLISAEAGLLEHGGLLYPKLQSGHAGFPTQFRIRLTHPQTTLYVRIESALPELTHIALLSDAALGREVQRDTLRQGVFIGAAGLMLLLTLANWLFTGNNIYRDFAIYISSYVLFTLCLNGYMSAYFLLDRPHLLAKLSLFSFAAAVSSSVWFSLSVLDLRKQMPRTAKWLRNLLVVVFLLAMAGFGVDRTEIVTRMMWLSYLPFGLLLLGLSAYLAWKLRSTQALLAFGAFTSFSVFDKAPLLTMLGVFPVTEWTIDLAKIGFVFQMLLTHLFLLIRIRSQRELERRALASRLEAEAERVRRRELTQFLGMFGHEVRTPLSIIDAATQSLEVLAGSDAPKVQLRHKRIRTAVARLTLLAREALSRERIEAGAWTARYRPVDMEAMLSDTLTLHGIQVPELRVATHMRLQALVGGAPDGAFELDAPDGLPYMVADPEMLELALGNLIDNACKYANPGSVVRLSISMAEEDGDGPVLVLFEVYSQGPQLSPTELSQVFDKYWRRNKVHEVGGAGLGLHLVRLIARAHGGSVRARALPEEWTCFTLMVPLSPSANDTAQAPA